MELSGLKFEPCTAVCVAMASRFVQSLLSDLIFGYTALRINLFTQYLSARSNTLEISLHTKLQSYEILNENIRLFNILDVSEQSLETKHCQPKGKSIPPNMAERMFIFSSISIEWVNRDAKASFACFGRIVYNQFDTGSNGTIKPFPQRDPAGNNFVYRMLSQQNSFMLELPRQGIRPAPAPTRAKFGELAVTMVLPNMAALTLSCNWMVWCKFFGLL
ncbi:hypothetical protein N7G274_003753 [Stereocaulon virgatum]|uniref:Uncharacterized protein n=1 Tax=Stereocaulon virgatum TaxID=373712 RepID=A0ABR4AF26_9LECA